MCPSNHPAPLTCSSEKEEAVNRALKLMNLTSLADAIIGSAETSACVHAMVHNLVMQLQGRVV